MNSLALTDVRQRLDLLERNVRRWKFLASITMIVLVFLVFIGARPSNVVDELRAKRFVIVGPNGNPAGEFSAKEGSSVLKLSDASGKARVVLSHAYDTPSGLVILDGKQVRADLSLKLDDSVALDLFDKVGKLRKVFAVRADGVTE